MQLSDTGRLEGARASAWAGYVADRCLLVFTFGWLLIRLDKHLRASLRPDFVYEPFVWLGQLVFPSYPPNVVWYGLFGVTACAVAICLWRPRAVAARLAVALGVLLLMTPEYSFGKISHVNHLLLLGHLYALFLPVARPTAETALGQAEAWAWYRVLLLFPYTMAGLWKVVDMTVRAVLKPGMTWLHPDAVLISSVTAYRGMDLPLTMPRLLESFHWIGPFGYLLLTALLSVASLAAFRRPLLPLAIATITVFHLNNAFALNVQFFSTIIVAAVLLFPYDRLWPASGGVSVVSRSFEGKGGGAHYRRIYDDGAVDRFDGFFAYRERMADRSWLFASVLFYPGMAWVATRLMKQPPVSENSVS